ncbi:hypothetical protein LCGC14_1263080 [marine sediment metagenome]|uniref:Uncharacterized protein n=1 Tax=marine sediment metagenome TaxID=412755 RepID=A0A0F9LLH6_9ZZZZ
MKDKGTITIMWRGVRKITVTNNDRLDIHEIYDLFFRITGERCSVTIHDGNSTIHCETGVKE